MPPAFVTNSRIYFSYLILYFFFFVSRKNQHSLRRRQLRYLWRNSRSSRSRLVSRYYRRFFLSHFHTLVLTFYFFHFFCMNSLTTRIVSFKSKTCFFFFFFFYVFVFVLYLYCSARQRVALCYFFFLILVGPRFARKVTRSRYILLYHSSCYFYFEIEMLAQRAIFIGLAGSDALIFNFNFYLLSFFFFRVRVLQKYTLCADPNITSCHNRISMVKFYRDFTGYKLQTIRIPNYRGWNRPSAIRVSTVDNKNLFRIRTFFCLFSWYFFFHPLTIANIHKYPLTRKYIRAYITTEWRLQFTSA